MLKCDVLTILCHHQSVIYASAQQNNEKHTRPLIEEARAAKVFLPQEFLDSIERRLAMHKAKQPAPEA